MLFFSNTFTITSCMHGHMLIVLMCFKLNIVSSIYKTLQIDRLHVTLLTIYLRSYIYWSTKLIHLYFREFHELSLNEEFWVGLWSVQREWRTIIAVIVFGLGHLQWQHGQASQTIAFKYLAIYPISHWNSIKDCVRVFLSKKLRHPCGM